tara:strand:- start:183 stop:398 length:216 start_codon:yes stop_codon:yes gene_type:complete
MKPIKFFTDDIEIVPHSATDAAHLNRRVSINEFAQGHPVALYETDDGELLCQRRPFGKHEQCPAFIEGPGA